MESIVEKGDNYRLEKIDEIRKIIEEERDKRAAFSTRYNRCIKAINFIDESLVFLSIGLGIAGIGILSTILAPPTAIILEGLLGAALGAGGLNIIGSHINNKLLIKAEKHQKIKTLAEAKLNTISDHVSKALEDNFISDQEYSLISSELVKFTAMKEEIRSKFKAEIEKEKHFFRRKCRNVQEQTAAA